MVPPVRPRRLRRRRLAPGRRPHEHRRLDLAHPRHPEPVVAAVSPCRRARGVRARRPTHHQAGRSPESSGARWWRAGDHRAAHRLRGPQRLGVRRGRHRGQLRLRTGAGVPPAAPVRPLPTRGAGTGAGGVLGRRDARRRRRVGRDPGRRRRGPHMAIGLPRLGGDGGRGRCGVRPSDGTGGRFVGDTGHHRAGAPPGGPRR